MENERLKALPLRIIPPNPKPPPIFIPPCLVLDVRVTVLVEPLVVVVEDDEEPP